MAVLVAIALAAVVFLRPAHHHPAATSADNTETSPLAQYAVLPRPQTAADRIDAAPAPPLGGTTNFDLPALTRVVIVGGVRVSLFVEHLVPSHALPKASVKGNDPKDAVSLVTPQALRKLQRSNTGAGYH